MLKRLVRERLGLRSNYVGATAYSLNGRAIRSCQISLEAIEGQDLVTIEGLSANGRLHRLQQAFIDHGAFQCAYCTSGMVMTAFDLLDRIPNPTPEAICGAHGSQPVPLRCAATHRRCDPISGYASVKRRQRGPKMPSALVVRPGTAMSRRSFIELCGSGVVVLVGMAPLATRAQAGTTANTTLQGLNSGIRSPSEWAI